MKPCQVRKLHETLLQTAQDPFINYTKFYLFFLKKMKPRLENCAKPFYKLRQIIYF